MPKIIEHLGQAYISKWTKDIEDATYRTVWFHMGTSPGSLNLPARNPDCARAQVAAAAVVRWDGGSGRGIRVVDDQIRILIADDHPLMRKGLRLSVEEDRGLKVVGEASDGEAALSLIKKLHPHVALLDIEMPKLDGLGVARELVKSGLKTEIIFLTFHSNQDLFRSAMELGCKGYILKDSAVQEVVAGIHAVASGRPYISSAITTDLLQSRNRPDPQSGHALTSNLTPTELRIMRLIVQGKTSKEIGAELSIHYRTVENHRTSMCRKLELEGEGANALLRFALQNKNLL